jgi:hypothetical protein
VPSLYEQSVLLRALAETEPLGAERDAELRSRLRVTQSRLEELIGEAVDLELVRPTAGWPLTEAGAFLAAQQSVAIKDLRQRGRKRYHSFMEYTPAKWYPDR